MRSTVITTSGTSANAIAGVGLTYRVSAVDTILPWPRVIQSLTGNKWMTATVLAGFIGFTKIDSITYACYDCGGSASRNPVTHEMYCDQGCQPGSLEA